MVLLFDVGNTHTHLGLAGSHRVLRQADILTANWLDGEAARRVVAFARTSPISGVAVCSVVPAVTPRIRELAQRQWGLGAFELSAKTVGGLGIDYPRPQTIGADRLANALAVRSHYGTPAVVIDFGTAVTFDVVDRRGHYVGGIIAPGLSAMTSYLHEKTALLPRIHIREIDAAIGKSTAEAMLIGAVHGYRGLIRELLREIRNELRCRKLQVVATGGYARLLAARLPEIQAVDPLLTLEGLRLAATASLRAS